MRILGKLLWKGYYYLYLIVALYLALEFFRPDSAINFYYRFLVGFDVIFLIPYEFNLVSVLVNLLSLFPVYAYVNHTVSFTPQFSRWLLVLRLVLDIFGRSFEIKMNQAMVFHSRRLAAVIIAAYVLFYLPSYWAHFRYAFRTKISR